MKLIIYTNVLVAISACKFVSYGLISISHNMPEINVNFCCCMTHDFLACTLFCSTGVFNSKIKLIPSFVWKLLNLTFVRHNNSCCLCIHDSKNKRSYFQWKICITDEIRYDVTAVNTKLHVQIGLLILKFSLPQLS